MSQIWLITYANGDTQTETGTDEQDVRDFLKRSYAHKGAVESVVLHPDYIVVE